MFCDVGYFARLQIPCQELDTELAVSVPLIDMKIFLDGERRTRPIGLRLRESDYQKLLDMAEESGTTPTKVALVIIERALLNGIELAHPDAIS